MTKRNTFSELMEGVDAMKLHREGKITLRSYVAKETHLPKVEAAHIREARERRNLSQAVFAQKLRVSLRTYQKWEQGIAAPNEQAKLLILLTENYPDMMQRIDSMSDDNFSKKIQSRVCESPPSYLPVKRKRKK